MIMITFSPQQNNQNAANYIGQKQNHNNGD